jgi:hypothetical protein
MHTLRIKLVIGKRRWVFFWNRFPVEISNDTGSLLVKSENAEFNLELKKQLEAFVEEGRVTGIVAQKTDYPTGKKIAHLIVTKGPEDPAFLAWLWESDFWDTVIIPDYKISKADSEIVML